jgi:hypothetical protein
MALKVFDFECGTSGATVIVVREPLMVLCADDSAIDTNIKLLKDNLDTVAFKMKNAIRQQKKKPDL